MRKFESHILSWGQLFLWSDFLSGLWSAEAKCCLWSWNCMCIHSSGHQSLHWDIFVTDDRDTTPWEKATSVNSLTSEAKGIWFHLLVKIWQLGDWETLALTPILSLGVAIFLFHNFFFLVYWKIIRNPVLVIVFCVYVFCFFQFSEIQTFEIGKLE